MTNTLLALARRGNENRVKKSRVGELNRLLTARRLAAIALRLLGELSTDQTKRLRVGWLQSMEQSRFTSRTVVI